MLLIQTKRKNEAKQVQQKQQIVIACSSPSIKEHVFFCIFSIFYLPKSGYHENEEDMKKTQH